MNKENLMKLATYLLSDKLKAEFDMLKFTQYNLQQHQEQATECGTVGCAAGHGPYAGIPKHSTETWMRYTERVFGLIDAYYDPGAYKESNYLWNWLFSARWRATDNSAKGAAKRILYLIRHGLPNNWESQLEGLEPLCYLDEKL